MILWGVRLHYLNGATVSEVVYKALQRTQDLGQVQESRNGSAKAIFNAVMEVENPRARHLALQGRKSNIFQLIAETFWVMAGANAVEPYLKFFLPRAPQYSDNGQTWHGAYGPRMYEYDQLASAIERFKTDGINTRRSFVQIGMPEYDSDPAIAETYGEGHKPKDIPCNREIHFYVDEGGFHTKVIQRSGDLLFGAGSINPFEFTFLHELMYNEVKKIYPDLKLGSYIWDVTNAHFYSPFYDQVDTVLAVSQDLHLANTLPLIGPVGGESAWKPFFGTILSYASHLISVPVSGSFSFGQEVAKSWSDIEQLFDDHGIPRNSLIPVYANLVFTYIANKRMKDMAGDAKQAVLPMDYERLLDGDLYESVLQSSFRNFPLNRQ